MADSANETVNRFGIGPPNAIGFGTVPNLSTYYDISTSPWTLYAFLFGAWNQVGSTSGSGDVIGPAGATAGDFVMFNGATGKVIKDTGLSPSTDGTFAGNSDFLIPTQKATKSYVDAVAQGLDVKASCLLATAAALPTNTYANGASGVGATLTATGNAALTVDGAAVNNGDRVLVKNEAAGANNGIYTVTDKGSIGTPYILTRATDFDTAAKIGNGAFVFIEAGAVDTGAGFVCTTTGAIIVGTTALTFTQFSGAGEITAGTGLSKSGNTLSIANTGVAAAAYGSAGAIPVITLNAQGQATAATTVTPALSLAAPEVVTSGSQSEIIFATIPATWRHLEIEFSGRGTNASTEVGLQVQFNGDTGTNYNSERLNGFGSTANGQETLGAAFILTNGICGSTAPANAVGISSMKILNYRNSASQRNMSYSGGFTKANSTGNLITSAGYGEWKNAANAITQVRLFLSAGNFVDGSVCTLYGRM